MVEGLKGPATGMGGNAVIGIHHGEYRGGNIGGAYVGGPAVQLLDEA